MPPPLTIEIDEQRQFQYKSGIEYKTYIQNSLLKNKASIEYAIDLVSDRYASEEYFRRFRKLASIVTLRNDKRILNEPKQSVHRIPQSERTQLILFPEKYRKSKGKPNDPFFLHYHGFVSFSRNLSPVEQVDFIYDWNTYAEKLGLVREYRADFCQMKPLPFNDMKKAKILYATKQQHLTEEYVGKEIEIGERILSD